MNSLFSTIFGSGEPPSFHPKRWTYQKRFTEDNNILVCAQFVLKNTYPNEEHVKSTKLYFLKISVIVVLLIVTCIQRRCQLLNVKLAARAFATVWVSSRYTW